MANLYDTANLGPVIGTRLVAGLGNNPDVDLGVTLPEDIWAGGGVYPWLTAATALEVVSASANDAAAGTGARTILIEGLLADFTEISQTVTLNGLAAVAIPTPLYRINGITCLTAGSNGTNVGNITIRDAGGGTTRGIAPAGFGRNRSSAFTVPAGKTLHLTSSTFCINRPSSARDATLSFFIRPNGGAYTLNSEISVDGNPLVRELTPHVPLPEKTDFIFRCTSVSADNTDITASWLAFLKDN